MPLLKNQEDEIAFERLYIHYLKQLKSASPQNLFSNKK